MSKKEIAMNLIQEPSTGLIREYIDKFDSEQDTNEKTVKMVFSELGYDSLESILVKVIVLNSRYSTMLNDNKPSEERIARALSENRRIMPNVVQVAEKLFAFEKEGRFQGCKTIHEISALIKEFKQFDNPFSQPYSFITKYCSFRFDEIEVAVCDNYVRAMLYLINEKMIHDKQKGFTGSFNNSDLDDYDTFLKIISSFALKFAPGFSGKEIDKYLWQYGKDLAKDGFDIRTVL